MRHQAKPRPKALLLLGVAALALTPLAAQAQAAPAPGAYAIASQDLGAALAELSRASGRNIVASSDLVRGKRTAGYRGQGGLDQALTAVLAGTGLTWRVNDSGTYLVIRREAQDAPVTPRGRPAAPRAEVRPADPEPAVIEDVVVTARRMEERIIDVPVAVSAFSEERLEDLRIEGGSELLRAVPNVNFSKDNFTGYNFSIRGVGTKAISVTTDPAVAISFNNTPLLRNRLFEQEYFDIQRVEVLRGPQGTLYGRNATAGVVNMLPNLPRLGQFDGEFQGELGNYDTRRARGYLNLPLGETLALRFAGALTQRDGFDYNTVTDQNVNGRDLWAGRVGVLWQPDERFRLNLLWEHFEENDDRSRTGKQLCTRGGHPSQINWTDPGGAPRVSPVQTRWTTSALTQGCQSASLFSDDAYGVPNGRGFPVVIGLILATPYIGRNTANGFDGNYLFPTDIDPFAVAGNRQSPDLRQISTFYDPKFEAKNDVFQMNLDWDLSDQLTLFSQTLYMEDSYYGSQDFFRYNPAPGLMYSRDQLGTITGLPSTVNVRWDPFLGVSPQGRGTFIDPQLGELDRLAAIDISQSESRQWSQEFRLQSSFDGRFNFNVGANWLKFETQEDYFIFSNAFTIMAIAQNASAGWNSDCTLHNNATPLPTANINACAYVDPNPISRLGGDGHNYYRSLNISETESWSAFGEGYFQLTDSLRLTLGLRYTDDSKASTPVPTQLLAANTPYGGGNVGRGYPREPEIEQNWNATTGRLAIDWRPDLSFADDALVYASYSRGYKAGGGNPIGADANPNISNYPLYETSFDPEYVDAFEIGFKSLMDGGRFMLNGSAFLYEYEDYQISQFIDRMNHTENFDARTWGIELESAWTPTRNLRFDATLGLLRTRIDDGQSSIDVMDRLQGRTDYSIMRPWPNSPATCVVPNDILARYIQNADFRTANSIGYAFVMMMCPGPSIFQGGFLPGSVWSRSYGDAWGPLVWDPVKDGPNQGRGFSADLSGNELPNAPEMTFNIGAQYRIELPHGWDLVVRGDYYRQSDSFMRVYNSDYDRLKGWGNANLAVTLTNPSSDLVVQAYVKNVFDDTPITDGYTGPDELGNFTNVFTLDPRILGVSVRKAF